MRILIAGLLLTLSIGAYAPPAGAAEEFRVASWNVKRLGHAADQKDIPTIARVASYFDFIALQEVMEHNALKQLETHLERITGQDWQAIASETIGRGSYREAYAFIWRSSRIAYKDGALVYLDRGDIFAREPFSARFQSRASGRTFVASNLHVLFGKDKADRIPELRALDDYWSYLESAYAGENNILMFGDFNMTPDEPSFSELRRHATPAVVHGASTLSRATGRYSNLYDNIWVDLDADVVDDIQAGVFGYAQVFDMDHETARSTVSDHAPVFMKLRLGAK